jgi:predicted HTH domain antitoxin|tara:strand:- start:498 stop:662 length:165 start_codon:yes stop_codon:yes gene_type:complete
MNETLNPQGLSVSVPYLRDLESGRSIPSLRLAIAIEDFTKKKVTVRDWLGLRLR